MVRTQIQLTEEQAAQLKESAARTGVSMAELIRRAVDRAVAEEPSPSRADLLARAKAAAGRFSSGRTDGAVNHDEHLSDAFR